MTIHRLIGIASALFAIGVLVGCGRAERKPGDTIEREGEPAVISADDNDPKMAAAFEKARSTLDQFIAALNNPKPLQSAFSVKLLVMDGDHGEHMWILPVRYQDGTFYGKINNEPDQVTTVKIGDEVSVAKDKISDWMYLENGKLIGGFTLRVLRESMSENERREFDQSVPFIIE